MSILQVHLISPTYLLIDNDLLDYSVSSRASNTVLN